MDVKFPFIFLSVRLGLSCPNRRAKKRTSSRREPKHDTSSFGLIYPGHGVFQVLFQQKAISIFVGNKNRNITRDSVFVLIVYIWRTEMTVPDWSGARLAQTVPLIRNILHMS